MVDKSVANTYLAMKFCKHVYGNIWYLIILLDWDADVACTYQVLKIAFLGTFSNIQPTQIELLHLKVLKLFPKPLYDMFVSFNIQI